MANAKTLQLFAGDPRIQLCAIEYPRGGLIERLTGWQGAAEVLRQQTLGLDPTEYVIIDPDSRLTQLGLLPLVADERPYLFFDSRSYCAAGLQKLSALTAHWLQQVFDIAESIYPLLCAFAVRCRCRAAHRQRPEEACHAADCQRQSWHWGQSRETAAGPVRVSAAGSAVVRGAIVILDKGGDAEEVARVDALVAMVGGEGFRVLALDERRDMVSSPAEVGGHHC